MTAKSTSSQHSLSVLFGRLHEVKLWLAVNVLHLNDDKSEVLLISHGNKAPPPPPPMSSALCLPTLGPPAVNRAVKIYPKLQMDAHINSEANL